MKLLQKKLKSKKGFTLIEMLVVVAIIAILVAISIPMVSGALDKARKAADDANLQAAKSVALLAEMEGTYSGQYFYDVSKGELAQTGYDAATDAPQASSNTKKSITVTFGTNHRIEGDVNWGDYIGS